MIHFGGDFGALLFLLCDFSGEITSELLMAMAKRVLIQAPFFAQNLEPEFIPRRVNPAGKPVPSKIMARSMCHFAYLSLQALTMRCCLGALLYTYIYIYIYILTFNLSSLSGMMVPLNFPAFIRFRAAQPPTMPYDMSMTTGWFFCHAMAATAITTGLNQCAGASRYAAGAQRGACVAG